MLDYMSEMHVESSNIVSKCENNFYVEITECYIFIKFYISGTKKGCSVCFSREVATLTCMFQNVSKSGQYLWKLVLMSTLEVRHIP